MSPLRLKLHEALVLRGLSENTREAYIYSVARLSRYYAGRSPHRLSGDQVQKFLVHLIEERHLSRSSVNVYGCAFRFFYGTVLGLAGDEFRIPLCAAAQALPEILSREELSRLFDVTRHAKSRALLRLAYTTGLRVSELCHLAPGHIDSAADRMFIHVVAGKGGKDRYVPLTSETLELLREWWPSNNSRAWIFARTTDPSRPMDILNAQRWYRAACADAKITKRGGIHTLRHCYATHLLEAGVDLHSLSRWLGHRHISTTTRYLHLARPDLPAGARRDPLALLRALPAVSDKKRKPRKARLVH